MSRSAGSISKSVLDIGVGILRWGSLLSAGLLGGSLFGIDRMAGAVSDQRRSSTGLGLSIGEQKAFQVNLGRFVNPDAFLGGINSAVSDVSKQGPLFALGVNPNQSTAEVAVDTLKRVRALALATPVNQLGILESSRRLGELGLGVEDLRRLRSTSPQEFNAQMAHLASDTGALGIGGGTAKQWQDFTTQMQRAGQSIEKVFVNGLVPLAGPLEHLSAAVVKFLTTLTAKDGPIEHGINNLAHWIDDFSSNVASSKFLDSVKQFVSDTGELADAMHGIVDAVKHPGEAAGNAVVGAVKADVIGGHKALWEGVKFGGSLLGKAGDWIAKQAAMAQLAMMDAEYGLPAGTLEYVWGKESSFGFNPKDQPGKNGAAGPFQIKPSVAGGIDTHNFGASSHRAAQLIKDELARYHGDVAKAIAAYHLGDPTMDKISSQYGSNWRKQVPYVSDLGPQKGMTLTIINQTGGAAVPVLAAQTP